MAQPAPIASIYGEFVIGPAGALKTISAGHMLGSRLRLGDDGKPAWVDLQWREKNGEVTQVEMPYVQAMYVLSLLKSHQLDSGYPFPDDPRAPTSR
jgi:hypothetical protein